MGRTSKSQEAEDYKSQGPIGERLLVTEGLGNVPQIEAITLLLWATWLHPTLQPT